MKERFNHYVKDKDGHIEMEIFYDGKKINVHYPRYEILPTKLRGKCQTFAEMRDYQVGMLIFAYNRSEFEQFEKEFYEWRERCQKTKQP